MPNLSNTDTCPACAELAAAWPYIDLTSELIREIVAHFRTCPLTTAACDAGRAQLASREAEAVAVEIDEKELQHDEQTEMQELRQTVSP